MEFIKLDKEFVKTLEIETIENEYVYALRKDNEVVGIAILNEDNGIENPIKIYVLDKYQSNGYGTILFKNIVSVLKEKGYKKIYLNIEEDNIRIINIISKFKALHLGKKDTIEKYLLPIENF